MPHQALVVLVEDGVGLPAEMLDELNVRLKEIERAAEIYSFISAHCCRKSGSSESLVLIEEVCRDMRAPRRLN